MPSRIGPCPEPARRLDDDVDSKLLPWECSGVRLGECGDVNTVDDDAVLRRRDGSIECSVNGVAVKEVCQRRRIDEIVDRGPLDVCFAWLPGRRARSR
jgi:hypothetical protein